MNFWPLNDKNQKGSESLKFKNRNPFIQLLFKRFYLPYKSAQVRTLHRAFLHLEMVV
jgi:hypothetical protein